MKKYITILLAAFVLGACNHEPKTTESTSTTTVEQTTDITPTPAPETPDDPASKPVENEPVETTVKEKAGVHPISLHWISWDKPGKATVTPLGDGWFKIVGQQKKNDQNYLKIDGKLKRIAANELEFEGTVETRTETTNNGEPCVKDGKQRFFGKDGRTYYRLQKMENCEGGMLVDYVDIYPGTSSL